MRQHDVQEVVDAWDTDEPVAEKYRHMKRWLRSDWPTLAEALDKLSAACPVNVEHHRGPGTGTCVYCGVPMPDRMALRGVSQETSCEPPACG